ncbi:hypothetical protein B7L09_02885 [Pseudomonas mandelii]|nr:hypothetical protein B7L09_02885 [Pseudomonas mandelii]
MGNGAILCDGDAAHDNRRGAILRQVQIKCGSELARDGGMSDTIDVECQAAFASKPAPTGGFD